MIRVVDYETDLDVRFTCERLRCGLAAALAFGREVVAATAQGIPPPVA
jgi:hypothetical protein